MTVVVYFKGPVYLHALSSAREYYTDTVNMNSNIMTCLIIQVAEKFKLDSTVEARAPRVGHDYRNKPLLRGATEQKTRGFRFGPGGRDIRLVQWQHSGTDFTVCINVRTILAQTGEPKNAYIINTSDRVLFQQSN
jgi:hypothetical protein